MSSRALKAEEAKVLKANVICNDGIAIVVNKSNPVGNISPEQLFNIYSKKYKNWKSIASSFDKSIVRPPVDDSPGNVENPVPEQEAVLKMY